MTITSSQRPVAQFLVTDPPEPLRVLDIDGTLGAGVAPPLDDAQVVDALQWMFLSRGVDEKGFGLHRQGKFGTFSPVNGQEAAIVGSAFALDPKRDWIVPQYREMPALIRHGYPLENFFRYFMGDPAGGGIPADVNILPIQISIAAHLPHAVGLAWGLRQQKKDAVVIVYFGDGASSEGDFHEACNLAGVVRAPVIFFLQNNGWAISTPRERQTAGKTLAERAPAYGFPGALVDGNDLFAVYLATREAVERARAGEGPTLIEALTYRLGPHTTSDDPKRYRADAEVAVHREADPVARVERYLTARGALSDARRAQLRAEVDARLERAIEAASSAVPHAGQMFEHVYRDPPQRMLAQRERWTGER